MARTIPGALELKDASNLVDRLVKRAEKLETMIKDPSVSLELVQKQRVLLFNTTADLISIKHYAEDGT
jgi:hypothetical protein